MLVLAHLHRSVPTQQDHSLGHLAFKWRSSFAKALAKLSPNFREKSPNSFYKMKHIYMINIKYKISSSSSSSRSSSSSSSSSNNSGSTWTFAKTLARKKILSPFQKKTLAETVNCIPKGLRKGNPFHGPFAQLSCIRPYHFAFTQMGALNGDRESLNPYYWGYYNPPLWHGNSASTRPLAHLETSKASLFIRIPIMAKVQSLYSWVVEPLILHLLL